jgi:hypothetical protein
MPPAEATSFQLQMARLSDHFRFIVCDQAGLIHQR